MIHVQIVYGYITYDEYQWRIESVNTVSETRLDKNGIIY